MWIGLGALESFLMGENVSVLAACWPDDALLVAHREMYKRTAARYEMRVDVAKLVGASADDGSREDVVLLSLAFF